MPVKAKTCKMCGRQFQTTDTPQYWGFGEARCNIGAGCDNRQLENEIIKDTLCKDCTFNCDCKLADDECWPLWFFRG